MCPSCGLHRARLKRVDHYLSFFFIPLFPVKRGTPVLICDNCGIIGDGYGEPGTPFEGRGNTCPSCGRLLESHFRFCPYCGKGLR